MRIDTRVITLDVPSQEVITLDNVTIKVNAVLYVMVVNPDWAIVKVMDYIRATLLSRCKQLNEQFQTII